MDTMAQVFQQILNQPEAFSRMRAEMVQLRSEGVPKSDIYAALEALRSQAEDAQEDIILEAMDVLMGFCRLEMRID